MMDKKNTLLLTVIAVATLLVAVVGATFAYFTASAGTNEASEVNVQTRAVDITSTTATDVTMVVELSDMLSGSANAANDYSKYKTNTSATIQLENSVGSEGGTRTCSYNVVYTPRADGVYVTTPEAVTNGLHEFTIQATANVVGTGVSSVTTISEFDLGTISTATPTNLNTAPITFVVTGADVGSSITWTFDVRYYNLDIDQTPNAGKTFGGSLSFVPTGSELCTTA